MDRTLDGLPYRIPGPAGGTGWDAPQAPRTAHHSKQPQRRFSQAPWQSMLHHARIAPHGTLRLDASLALLRSYALAARFEQVARLPVFVDALSWVGKDASVLLRDPTACIRATVHAAVFEARKDEIEVGAVMLLRNVTALAYQERRQTGFRVDADACLHMSIQPSNVEHVFPVSVKTPLGKVEMLVPCDSYTASAKDPPKLVRKPVRQKLAPVQRGPLRPRSDVQNRQRRPASANMQPNIHGDDRRPYPSHAQHNTSVQQQQPHTNQLPGKRPNPNPHLQTPSHLQYAQRRYGMQPQQKRRAPNPTPVPTPAPQTSVNSLTDDQLDSLLGDVDVDAIIAARNAPISSAGTEPMPPSDPSSNPSTTTGVPPTPISIESQKSAPERSPISDSHQMSTAPSEQQPTPSSTTQNDTATVQKTPTTVDDAMLNSLFDGLDSSDF